MGGSLSNEITKFNIGNYISLQETLKLARKEQQRYRKILKYIETHKPREEVSGFADDILIEDHEKYIMGDYNLQCSMRSFKLKDGVYAYDWQVAHSCQFENRKLSYVPRRIVLTSKDISPLQEKIYKYTEEERQKFLMFIWGEMDKIPSDVLYSTESLSASDIEKTVIHETIEDGKTPYIEYIQEPLGMYDTHVKETVAYCDGKGKWLSEMILFPKKNEIVTLIANPNDNQKNHCSWVCKNTEVESWVKEHTTPEDDPTKLIEITGDIETSQTLQKLVKNYNQRKRGL